LRACHLGYIQTDERNETHYEVVIQFGCSETAPVGSENGELVKKMLDEYMQGFSERNKNMRVFNSVLHADESSYHLHIDFVPFYTQNRKSGLSTGVSMKAALTEQGFSNKHVKANSLIAWQNSEMKVMESILNNHNLERDIKNAKHKHRSVPEYKASQDWRKLPKRKKNMPTWGTIEEHYQKAQEYISILTVENDKLTAERNSPYKSFFYGDVDKQNFVQSKLDELTIPYRESDNGIEAKACYAEQIRSIEKQYRAEPITHRDKLRDTLDKIVMQSKDYDDIFARLKSFDYEVKFGKYTAVKPKDGDKFIRIKSLGEYYNETALRNRILKRNIYEADVDNKANEIDDKHSLSFFYQATVKHYFVTFRSGLLPARKIRKNKPFTWINDAELDRLASLNKKINEGVSVQSLRNDLARLEKPIAEHEAKLNGLNIELNNFERLYKAAVLIFEKNNYNPTARKLLADFDVTAESYSGIPKLIDDNNVEIAELEQKLIEIRAEIKDVSETLTAFEGIASDTYVQNLVHAERERQKAEEIGNGIKSADANLYDSIKTDLLAEKVVEVVEQKIEEPIVQYQPPKPPRRG
jgi:hypothetical protein